MRLYAAIVSENTRKPPSGSLNGMGKAIGDLAALKKYIDESWTRITELRQAHPVVNWQAVFLAPEYFFSNRRVAKDRFFSHDVKRHILSGLGSISKSYPKFLIVPGTVLWTKDVYDQTSGGLVYNAIRATKANIRNQVAQTQYGTRGGKDWNIAGDIGATDVKIAQNIAYVCLGKQIIKYQKVGNYKEVEGEKGNIYFASGSIVGRFSVGGVKYGLEVCMDHAQGVMGSTTGSQGKVHVHLIISSYVGFKTHNAPVTLHSSTEGADLKATTDTGDYGRVDQVTGNVTKVINPGTKQIRFESGGGARLAAGFRANPVKMGPVTIWVIDLDEQKLGISNVTNYQIKDTALQAVKPDYTA